MNGLMMEVSLSHLSPRTIMFIVAMSQVAVHGHFVLGDPIWAALQKGFILVVCLLCIEKRTTVLAICNPILVCFSVFAVASMLFSDLPYSVVLTKYAGLIYPWMILLVPTTILSSVDRLRVVIALPFICFFTGLFFYFISGREFVVSHLIAGMYMPMRLQGASIPVHFGYLSAYGLIASSILFRRGILRFASGPIALCLLIFLLMSITRGAYLFTLLFLLIYWLPCINWSFASMQARFVFLLIVSLSAVAPFIHLIYRRTVIRGELDSSGRIEAWGYYLDRICESPIWGHGMGGAEYFYDYTVVFFRAPHNEYVRFAYDYGILGGVLIFLCLLWVCLGGIKRSQEKIALFALTLCFLVGCFHANMFSAMQMTTAFVLLLSAVRDMGTGTRQTTFCLPSHQKTKTAVVPHPCACGHDCAKEGYPCPCRGAGGHQSPDR
jgi:teichuronic acid biosynthesis protein TuaE